MSSTTQVGDSFRDAVAALLRTQYSDVVPEKFVCGTKVDVTFTDRDWGKASKVAVECKNYDAVLSKNDLEKIYAKYNPMVQAKEIDRVLVISRRPLGAAATSYVDALSEFRHLTFEILEEELFGIRGVVEKLEMHTAEDVSRYIEARFEDQPDTAFVAIDQWIQEKNAPALAVLGGYGQGKTSLAAHVASQAAKRYLADPVNRIPILIRLGEVVHETQLEGLFGKEFSARHHVKNYQFETLMHLNKLGRLLIILDGFDEMKHAMSAHDFESNFREFNRLLIGRAKVIILGRPNALPSEARELVFKGRTRIGDSTYKSPNYLAWSERKLSFFSIEEARELLKHVLLSSMSNSVPDELVQSRIADVMTHVPHDLLKRPVHVVLIGETAADLSFNFKGFNEYVLYSHFIREMVKRDQVGKPARKKVSVEDRLTFQRRLAWWAWSRQGESQGSFYREKFPEELLDDLPDAGSTDSESKRNEYLVSTLTDEKEAGILYFSHRSFQEFLVAEHMMLVTNGSAHSAYSKYLNPEISNFIMLAPNPDFLDRWYLTLGERNGPISLDYLWIFSRSHPFVSKLAKDIDLDTPASAETLTILLMAYTNDFLPAAELPKYARLLRNEIEHGSETSAAVAVISFMKMFRVCEDHLEAMKLLCSIILRALNIAEANRIGSQEAGAELLIPTKAQDFLLDWLKNDCRREMRKADRVISFDAGDKGSRSLSALAKSHLGEVFLLPGTDWRRIEETHEDSSPKIELEIASVYRLLPKNAREKYGKFLNASHVNFKFVGTDRRGSPAGRRKVAAPFATTD